MSDFFARMFAFLAPAKQPSVVRIGGNVDLGFDVEPMADRRRTAPVLPRSVHVSEFAVDPGHPAVITQNNEIPKYQQILTANGARSTFILPKALELKIMALEFGAKRVALFYSPSPPQREIKQALKELRNKLVIADYEVDEVDRPCDEKLIGRYIHDYKQRANVNDGTTGDSDAKQLWESWVTLAHRLGASDLHIFLNGSQAKVQIRVNGSMEHLPNSHKGIYTATEAEQAITWAYGQYTTANSNSASMYNKETNIYSMFKPMVIDGDKVGMRFQGIIGAYGPKVVCRLLSNDVDAPTLTYQQLGYEPSQIVLFKDAAKNSTGLILFVGVTGSGKTTTQKTFIETHPENGTAILYSVEEPVEYPLKNVHSIPIQRDLTNPEESKKKFNDVMGAIVRADPDGVMLGEIRDSATAATAQQIVETGHFCIATVHAHLISGVVPRLADPTIGFSRHVITSPNILTLMVYQGLVPTLCKACCINGGEDLRLHEIHYGDQELTEEETAVKLDEDVADMRELLLLLEQKFELPRSLFNFRKNGGCAHCNGRGTKRATVVAEMLMPDEEWLRLTRDKKDYEALAYFRSFSDCNLRSPDMTGKTVFEHALYKATLGVIDPRNCEHFDTFKRFKVIKKEQK